MRRPLAGQRLLSPESWALGVAAKLRAGEALDSWERVATAEALEHASGISKIAKRRGRKKSVSTLRTAIQRGSAVYACVTRHRKDNPGAALSDDQTFHAVGKPLKEFFDLTMTPIAVRKVYFAEMKRRNQLRDIQGET